MNSKIKTRIGNVNETLESLRGLLAMRIEFVSVASGETGIAQRGVELGRTNDAPRCPLGRICVRVLIGGRRICL